jgi:hypothetical protein
MVPPRRQHLFALLIPAVLVGACTSSSSDRTAQLLGRRLETSLAPDVAAGRASLEQLPNGARVTLADQSLFSGNGNGTKLTDAGRYTLASAIEGLLDPSITQVYVAGSPNGPIGLPDARTQAVTQYFTENGLGPVLRPSDQQSAVPAGASGVSQQGVTITAITNPG